MTVIVSSHTHQLLPPAGNKLAEIVSRVTGEFDGKIAEVSAVSLLGSWCALRASWEVI